MLPRDWVRTCLRTLLQATLLCCWFKTAASTKWAPKCLCGAEIPHNPGCEQEVNMLLSHCSFGCFYCSIKIPWRRKWWPTPLFLPGKSQGQRSLEGYGPWGHKESDTTEPLNMHRTSLVIQWLRLCASTAGGTDWIPEGSLVRGLRSHVPCSGATK